MPFYFTPQSAMPLSHGDASAHGKAGEMAGGQVAAQLEGQLGSHAEISQAHQFFAKSAESAACASTKALSPVLDVAGHAHAANQAVSPFIQLIMRMPGHVACVGSLFEAIGNFFAPAHAFSLHDVLSGNVHDAALSASFAEHVPIDPAILPSDAPILHDLGRLSMEGTAGLNSPHLSWQNAAHQALSAGPQKLADAHLANGQNVSGVLDVKKPQFETGNSGHAATESLKVAGTSAQDAQGGLLSGTDISPSGLKPVLADNQRLFADKIDQVQVGGKGAHMGNHMGGNGQAAGHVSGKLNVGGTPFDASAMSLNASGPLFDQLAGTGLSQNVGTELASAGRPSLDGTTDFAAKNSLPDASKSAPDLNKQSLPELAHGADPKSLPQGLNAGYNALAESTAQAVSPESIDLSQAQGQAQAAASALPQASTLPQATAPGAPSQLAAPSPAAAHGELAGMKAQALSLADINKPAFKGAYDSIGHQLKGHPTSANHAEHQVMDHIAHGHHGKNVAHFAAKPGIDQIAHRTGNQAHCHVPSQIARENGISASVERAPSSRVDGIHQANPMAKTFQPDALSIKGDGADSGAYTVQHGDSLWKIAEEKLGSGSRWHEIYDLNAKTLGENPALIHAGARLSLPGQAGGADALTSSAAKYVVHEGDSLWKIASEHLGGGQNWGQIYQANTGVVGQNPSLIFPGQELNLPGQAQVADLGQAQAGQALTQALPNSAQPVPAFNAQSMAQANTQAPSSDSPFGAGAASAMPAQQTAANAQTTSQGLVPSSLRPDLSFLGKDR